MTTGVKPVFFRKKKLRLFKNSQIVAPAEVPAEA